MLLRNFSVIVLLSLVIFVSGCIEQSQTDLCEEVKCPGVFWNDSACQCPEIPGTENTSVEETVIDFECNDYFWYSSENNNCDKGKICGNFTGKDIHVFGTKEECLNAVMKENQVIKNVYIQNLSFVKSPFTIKKGQYVRWINKDSVPHTVTSDIGNELDSSNLDTGEEYVHLFNVSGSYEYHCTIHPSMRGRIIVE